MKRPMSTLRRGRAWITIRHRHSCPLGTAGAAEPDCVSPELQPHIFVLDCNAVSLRMH